MQKVYQYKSDNLPHQLQVFVRMFPVFSSLFSVVAAIIKLNSIRFKQYYFGVQQSLSVRVTVTKFSNKKYNLDI